MPNIAANISTGKPNIGGAIYIAPTGTTLPTDATTALADAFKCLGYVSEDGVTNSDSITSGEVKAWGGDTVLSYTESRSDSWKFMLMESLNVEVLKAVYGADNVTGTLETGIVVNANATERSYSAWVIEMVLAGGVAKRVVLPEAKISEIADVQYVDNEPIGYEVTVSTRPDAAGNSHYEYIKKANA